MGVRFMSTAKNSEQGPDVYIGNGSKRSPFSSENGHSEMELMHSSIYHEHPGADRATITSSTQRSGDGGEASG